MPRVTSVNVHAMPIHTGQDPDSLSRDFAITDDLNADLLRAVGADYADGVDPSGDGASCSDIWQAWEHGYGIVAAGILFGATECAHVSAVQWAHALNGTLGEGFAYWTNTAQFAEWEAYCREHVTVCPSCEQSNFDASERGGGLEYAKCGNCLAPLSEGHPYGVEADEFSDLVYGYVTAATWSALEHDPEEDAEGLMTFHVGTTDLGVIHVQAETEEDATARVRADHAPTPISIEWVEVQRPEPGSDPYEYGPDDLDADALREIRSECEAFVRANLDDLRAYADVVGSMVDHPQAAGGGQLEAHECSAFERAGHDLYLTASGSGCGFWDRNLGELGERLSEASKVMSAEDMTLTLDASEGKIYS
jgi:hypothetical protein